MAANDNPPRKSIFTSLRGAEGASTPMSPLSNLTPTPSGAPSAPPPPPAADPVPPPPAADLEPLRQRVAELEAALRAAEPGSRSDDRIAALEKRLQENQQQAIEALSRYKEHEEARQQAQHTRIAELEQELAHVLHERREAAAREAAERASVAIQAAQKPAPTPEKTAPPDEAAAVEPASETETTSPSPESEDRAAALNESLQGSQRQTIEALARNDERDKARQTAQRKRIEELQEKLMRVIEGATMLGGASAEAPPSPARAPTDDRIAALEQRLQETQQQAIEAMVRHNEREEAQKIAQRELEESMRRLANQRRSEEFDRQMREQLAGQRKRIEELEQKLLAAAEEAGAGGRQERDEVHTALEARVESLAAENAAATAAAATERARQEAERSSRAQDIGALRAEFEELRRDQARRLDQLAARLETMAADAAGTERARRDSLEAALAQARAAAEFAQSRGEAVVGAIARAERSAEEGAAALKAAAEEAALERAAFEGRITMAVKTVERLETEIRGIILSRLLKLESESRRTEGQG